jgi:hypothetical protein
MSGALTNANTNAHQQFSATESSVPFDQTVTAGDNVSFVPDTAPTNVWSIHVCWQHFAGPSPLIR